MFSEMVHSSSFTDQTNQSTCRDMMSKYFLAESRFANPWVGMAWIICIANSSRSGCMVMGFASCHAEMSTSRREKIDMSSSSMIPGRNSCLPIEVRCLILQNHSSTVIISVLAFTGRGKTRCLRKSRQDLELKQKLVIWHQIRKRFVRKVLTQSQPIFNVGYC